jgi:hypothetical protein
LTDQQFTTLMNTAAQLEPGDRDPFLRSVANLFKRRSEVGDGEFNRGVREATSSRRS